MADTFDAIMIGSGIAGVSTAFHLTKRGCKVAVLERKSVASSLPSRLKATVSTASSLCRVKTACLLAASHSRTVLSSSPARAAVKILAGLTVGIVIIE
jgi:glycine/D-amino acid oxidase-like deaminating enzyme